MENWKVFKISYKGWKNEQVWEVSDKGNIRCNGEDVELNVMNDGYVHIKLGFKNRVHRIVANAFIPNPNNLPMVNHKDEDKTNNCVDNLEWCDGTYNINYGTAKKRMSESRKKYFETHDVWNKGLTKETSESIRIGTEKSTAGVKKYFETHSVWNKGKHGIYSEETLEKMRKNNCHKGETNGMYGNHTIFVYKDNVNKRIDKTELENYINNGWTRGMVHKQK